MEAVLPIEETDTVDFCTDDVLPGDEIAAPWSNPEEVFLLSPEPVPPGYRHFKSYSLTGIMLLSNFYRNIWALIISLVFNFRLLLPVAIPFLIASIMPGKDVKGQVYASYRQNWYFLFSR